MDLQNYDYLVEGWPGLFWINKVNYLIETLTEKRFIKLVDKMTSRRWDFIIRCPYNDLFDTVIATFDNDHKYLNLDEMKFALVRAYEFIKINQK